VDNALPLELAGLGYEVTAVSPAAGTGTSVCFDGVWRHRVGLARAPRSRFWRQYGGAALREAERIQPRRCFDVVLCPGELLDALAPLSPRGIRVVACPTRTAPELDAAIRQVLAAPR
jgi:hypothetical protein